MRTDDEADKIVNEGTMFYDELHAVLRRYLHEAPHLTYYEIIGAIECVKQDALDAKGKPPPSCQ